MQGSATIGRSKSDKHWRIGSNRNRSNRNRSDKNKNRRDKNKNRRDAGLSKISFAYVSFRETI
jgi:hypothetical protein